MVENLMQKTQEENNKIHGFKNRYGIIVPFKKEKIELSIKKAAKSLSSQKETAFSDTIASKIANFVIDRLNKSEDVYFISPDEKGRRIADISNVIDLVEIGLIEENLPYVATEFKKFRKNKEMARKNIKVKKNPKKSKDITDATMLIVESLTTKETSSWDPNKIINHLKDTTSLPIDVIVDVSKSVEQQIIRSGLQSVSTKLIREMVNNELSERGYKEELKDLSVYTIPKDFINDLLCSKSVENSNISNNNPEAVNLAIAELVLKQWALDDIFSPEIKKAHENGVLYLHDLGYPTRVYCSSHSVEYIKKYGLVGLLNLSTESNPAKSASVLTGHLNTFLASMQSNYAGALGMAYINIFYSPLLENMNYKQLKQVAQELIFNGSQNAFSRGNQSIKGSETIYVYDKIENDLKVIPIRDFYKTFDGNKDNGRYFALSLNKTTGKTELKEIYGAVEHKRKNKLVDVCCEKDVQTSVTEDHSLFSADYNGVIKETSPSDRTDHFIAIRDFDIKGLENKFIEMLKRKHHRITETIIHKMYERHPNVSNVSTLKILSINESKQQDEFVYDISVRDNENFLLGCGLFAHNTLFLDFNVHSGVPSYLKDVPAIGAGGKYMLRKRDGSKTFLIDEYRKDKISKQNLMELYLTEENEKRLVLRELWDSDNNKIVYDKKIKEDLQKRDERIITYGDYEKIAREFAVALLDVWGEGDRKGRIFSFPKCDFHVSEETFSDKAQYEVFLKACELASKNGSTYFVFDRDAVTLSACCRLRTTINDDYLLKHPESLRFCGFQNVTINIPQAAYRASKKGNKTLDGMKKELDYAVDLAIKAHVEKRDRIKEMMSGPGHVLWQIGKPSCDGRPYIDLDAATYIIGLIGVNDAVKFMLGREMHESDEAMEMSLKIVNHMFLRMKEYSKKHNMKFSLEESPAESAARKLAKIDLASYKDEAKNIVKGTDDAIYYTNSIHLAPEANVSLVERIRKQSKFHSIIESGAIVHAFVGEEKPSYETIAKLVKDTFFKTQCAQLTISPEFTYCYDCFNNMRGLKEKCDKCGSSNLVHETRIVGYFSKIENWNKSKRFGELVARHQGFYSVEKAGEKKEDKVIVLGEKTEIKCNDKICTIS